MYPANRLRELRGKQTLMEIAEKTGRSHMTVRNHEQRIQKLDPDDVFVYCMVYRVNPHDLFVIENGGPVDPGRWEDEESVELVAASA